MSYTRAKFFSGRHTANVPAKLVMKPDDVEKRLHGQPLPDAKKEVAISAGALEARRLLEEANRKFKEQQAMPDLKSALANAMSKWEEPAKEQSSNVATTPNGKTAFVVTNDVTRATFNEVLENPYKYTAAQLADVMSKKGFNPRSVSSLIYQMQHLGMVGKSAQLTFYPLVKEYTPLKTQHLTKIRKQHATGNVMPKSIIKRVAKPKEAAPVVDRPELTPPLPMSRYTTAAQVLESLSVKEAHALYVELKKMFG